jgi:hypothetical protein
MGGLNSKKGRAMLVLKKKQFVLTKENILSAYEEVKEFFGFASQAMRDADTLVKCFAAIGFQAEIEPNGDLTIVSYQENDQPIEMVLEALAPYVVKGSYLHFEEDGEKAEFRFDGKELAITL